VPAQLRHVVAVYSPYTAVTPHDNFRRSTAAAVSRPYVHHRRSRLQAAPPYKLTSSWPPPLGREYVTCTLYRRLGRLQAARTRHRRRFQAANVSTRRHPHNYYASSARSHLRAAAPTRSAQLLHVIGTFIIYVPPSSLYTTVSAARATTARRAPSGDRRARHSATSSTLHRGRRFKAPRVRQTSFPSGTAGVRSLPLAATAAREAQLPVVPTAQPRVSWPHTLQTAVDRAAAWSSHSRNLQVTRWNVGRTIYNSLWIKSTTHAGTRLPKKKSSVKIKCSNCCLPRSTALM